MHLYKNFENETFINLINKRYDFEFICPSCQKKNSTRLEIKKRLFNNNEYLIVYVNQLNCQGKFINIITTSVAFDLNDIEIDGTKFIFCSAILHVGTYEGGHYTCVIKNNNDYFEINNQSIIHYEKDKLEKLENIILIFLKKK